MTAAPGWNPRLYENCHSFVWEFGRDVLGLLAAQPGERIIDLGCGTGQLTAEIAATGAHVVGTDRSPEMIEQARRNFPRLHFEIADILAPPLVSGFDAVFSNAVLHWVKDAEQAVENIACMVKPGGRFVAEFGGHGNVRRLLRAVFAALEQLGVDEPQRLNPWYFPTVGEYAAVLERYGFEVSYAALFDRLTALDPGAEALAQWLQMFGPTFIEELDSTRRAEFVRLTEDHAREHLFRDGVWHADYRRIRVVAVRRVS